MPVKHWQFGRAGRGKSSTRWRQVALTTAALALCIGLLGMHQLSMNHSLISASGGAEHTATDHPPAGAAATSGVVHRTTPDFPALQHPGEDGCAGNCHSGPLAGCLLALALALAVIVWALRRPTVRALPPVRLLLTLARPHQAGRKWRPALSLAELSLRRT